MAYRLKDATEAAGQDIPNQGTEYAADLARRAHVQLMAWREAGQWWEQGPLAAHAAEMLQVWTRLPLLPLLLPHSTAQHPQHMRCVPCGMRPAMCARGLQRHTYMYIHACTLAGRA